MFITNGQLTNPYIKINKVNSKFSVLGEVRNPGTYFNYENQLNLFQATYIIKLLDSEQTSDILAELDDDVREKILENLSANLEYTTSGSVC